MQLQTNEATSAHLSINRLRLALRHAGSSPTRGTDSRVRDRFASVSPRAPLAQLAEQLTLNQRVGGSIPSRRTIIAPSQCGMAAPSARAPNHRSLCRPSARDVMQHGDRGSGGRQEALLARDRRAGGLFSCGRVMTPRRGANFGTFGSGAESGIQCAGGQTASAGWSRMDCQTTRGIRCRGSNRPPAS